jgi:hypothetical protein
LLESIGHDRLAFQELAMVEQTASSFQVGISTTKTSEVESFIRAMAVTTQHLGDKLLTKNSSVGILPLQYLVINRFP